MYQKHLDLILAAGHQAPSADNCQPWLFEIKKDTIFIHHNLSETNANHIYNIDYFADFVSLGMVLENITLQAKALGYYSDVKLLDPIPDKPLVEIKIKKIRESETAEILPMIMQRKTNRKAYDKKQLDEKILNFIQKIGKEKGVRVHLVNNRKTIKRFAHIIASHDAILWEDQELRKNLLRMLRFGKKFHPDGLSLESLELGMKQYIFKPIIKLANFFPLLWKALAIGSILHTRKSIDYSGHLAIITVAKKHHPHTYIEGGQAFQAIWLELTKNKIALQPLFGPLAFILNGKLKKGGLSMRHERIRKKIVSFFSEQFPHIETETPVAFLRIGHASFPSETSGRRNLKQAIKATK